ncbi:MAG: hypothetical protein ACKPBU_08255 [Alphaproteobacteria bacterium]
MGKKILGALAATGLSMLVVLAGLEAVLHAIGYPRTKTGHQRFFVEYDADRGWRNVPGATGLFSTDEYDVELQYNSRGIRGPEREQAKPDGVRRVVVLGDSFIEGYSVQREQRVSEVLEGLLSKADPAHRWEVIALGTAGYSTDQELLWLRSEGLAYRPDVVVDMFYMNDVWFNGQSKYWRGEKPAFVLEGGTLRLVNVPVPDTRPAGEKKKPKKEAGGLGHWIRSNSKLVAAAQLALENSPGLRGAASRIGLVSPRKDDDENGAPHVSDELSVFQKSPPPETENGWTMTRALFGEMKRESNAAGASFIAFHIPLKGTVYPESWAPTLSKLGIPADRLDPERVRSRFLDICASERLDCIEPTAEFRAAAEAGRARGERLYWLVDNHWNAGGHALAAELLAKRILSLPASPGATTPPGPDAAPQNKV